MKSRLQSNSKLNVLDGIKNCFKYEGVSGFFKGMSIPLYTISIINAISLAGNELTKKSIGKHNDNELTLAESIFCGFMAGVYCTPIVTPVELIKCKLQIQTQSKSNSYYKGVFDLVLKTYQSQKLKGLYRGNYITLVRETIGYGTQFGVYHSFKLFCCQRGNKSVEDITNFEYMIAGGFAGSLAWLVTYPIDVIKTLIQTGAKLDCLKLENNAKAESYIDIDKAASREGIKLYNYKAKYYDGGSFSCFMHVFYSRGFQGFFTGLGPVIISSFFANAVMFLLYEESKARFKSFYV